MTKDEIKAAFRYDPETGMLHWKVKRPGRSPNIGDVAGTLQKRKDTFYRIITLDGKKFPAHRLIWIMHKGSIPDGLVIDHRDGDGSNNRLHNLRPVTTTVNQRNRRRKHNGNPLGIGGVFSHRGGFRVHIGTTYHGWRKDFFEACCLRKSLESKLGFNFNGKDE